MIYHFIRVYSNISNNKKIENKNNKLRTSFVFYKFSKPKELKSVTLFTSSLEFFFFLFVF